MCVCALGADWLYVLVNMCVCVCVCMSGSWVVEWMGVEVPECVLTAACGYDVNEASCNHAYTHTHTHTYIQIES
jgi:hypothetical protein